ncbi:hypothetical protein MUGA111182_13240 [Mucilaginibacter galii]|uniref:Uncharacterized protein n=1 Tax=Mucilaginibacter galii TaxID=2005073 RepID=A0A917N1Q0_9SPHI|nr:hypothetical protein [Mucilaginibacter galii]GGI49267.1 hypothetical protein GCM10011425_04790 [Mucilaginibacter galii]
MDNLDDLKAIWHTAKTDALPSSQEMLQMIRKFRGQKLRNKWLMIISSLSLSAFLVSALFTGHTEYISTYIGGLLMALSGVLIAATNARSLKRFYRLDDCSNLDFVAFIEITRQNQVYYYKKTMVVIVVLCLVGWMLYMYEPLVKHWLWMGGVYSAFLVYMAIMWFVVRPRSFKKDQDKLNTMRQRLENISNQLK